MKFLITTNGCEPTKANVDSLRQVLINELGLFESSEPDIIVFFPCTFNQVIRNNSDSLINVILNDYKKAELILVTGCFLDKQFESNPKVKYSKYNELKNTLKSFLVHREYKRNTIPYSRKVPFVEISRGCYGACSFCSIVSVKGKHVSYSPDFIVKNIAELVNDGYHTIKLVGDEVAGYGMDCGSSLEKLISVIFEKFPNLKIELGQLNPNILKDWKSENYQFLSNSRIVGSIFLPLQSASNTILKKMNRYYTAEEFDFVYHQIKRVRDNDKISTDIIIGFPGETDGDHQQNVEFLKSHLFDFFGVFTFDKNDKKTKAGRMEDHVDEGIITRRYNEIINLVSIPNPA